MQAVEQPTWQLILKAAEHLDATIGDFTLAELIGEVKRFDPSRGRTSISPVVQGMTVNAGKGPASPCGQPLFRISHGSYRLSRDVGNVASIVDPIVKSKRQENRLGIPDEVVRGTRKASETLTSGHLEFQENQTGVSFDYLFGPYVQDARLVTVIDPYIRLFHQAKNLMEFIETVQKFNSEKSEISVQLMTIEDEDESKAAKQRDLLKQVQTSAESAGIRFTFEFDESRTLHDREISTDTGWKIVLGRGLDIFQYMSNGPLDMSNRIQSLRKVKKFGISYFESPTAHGQRSEVTKAKAQTPRAKSRPVAELDEGEYVIADIVLISCVKTKLVQAAAAKDLFVSALFRKERAYAESTGAPWYILSAENGLVTPDQWLNPYNKYLSKQSVKYRKDWGAKVVEVLRQIEGPMQGKVIEIHAGAAYVDAIRSGLQSHGAIVIEPLHDLRFGERLRWYSSETRARKRLAKPLDGDALPDIKTLVASLRDESSAMPPKNFIAAGSGGRRLPGLYSWWVDGDGALELTDALECDLTAGLIYVGLAGATQWPSGKPSSNTLWSRIESMHLGAKHEFSTLRRTIGAILAKAEGRGEIDEGALTSWIDLHLRVHVVPYTDADSLGRVEQTVLAELDPPLNLKGMPDTDLRKRVKELRRAVAH